MHKNVWQGCAYTVGLDFLDQVIFMLQTEMT